MIHVISDMEWQDFVDHNIVSDDVIEIIAIRIVFKHQQTDREIAIYNNHAARIENKIKHLNF